MLILGMNFMKKINHYLLTNHPVLWRTKAHYFVLFSLILGNILAFGFGYFPVKWYGARTMGVGFFLCQNLTLFILFAWFITQARNKIKHYNFWDEVLTFSIYILCTISLFGNSILFDRTLTHTKANLVSVEQIDIDKELIRDKREIDRRKYDSENYVPRSFPPQDIVDEMAERYQIGKSYQHAEIPEKVSEISAKVRSIYNSQLDINMRPNTIESFSSRGSALQYLPFILAALFIPLLLFLISHTHLRVVLGVAAIYTFFIVISSFLGVNIFGVTYIILYLILSILIIFRIGKIHRFATLLVVPYTPIITFFGTMFLLNNVNNEVIQLTFSILFTIIITVFSSAFLIKRYFEPRL